MGSEISPSTVRRLATYHRVLRELGDEGELLASSKTLAERSGVTPAQVRKDLSYFGQFGKRGLGYDIAHLAERIRSILGLDRRWRVGLIGAGNISAALFSYEPFRRQGFDIVAIFDSDPAKIGTRWDDLSIRPMSRFEEVARETGMNIAVVATPATAAQEAAEQAARAGIRAILNFAPRRLDIPSGVALRNVDMAAELESLSFALRAEESAKD
jgi:redox-sensing transcriptional repressor